MKIRPLARRFSVAAVLVTASLVSQVSNANAAPPRAADTVASEDGTLGLSPEQVLVVPRVLLRISGGAATLSVSAMVGTGDAVEDVATAIEANNRKDRGRANMDEQFVGLPKVVDRSTAGADGTWNGH